MKKHLGRGRKATALSAGILSLSFVLSPAYAVKPGTGTGVDLDIAQFRATSKVDLSSSQGAEIRLDLAVRNNGSVNATRKAILTGRSVPGNGLVFQHELDVFDDAGGKPTAFTVIPTALGLVPAAGGIRWQVFIDDDDPDDDVAAAITIVNP